MTRRQVLRSACAWSATALGQQILGAQPQAAAEIHYREYARCLPDYLAAQAADAWRRRNSRISGLKTPPEVREYQSWARRNFPELAGGLPERTPLHVRTT